MDHQQFPEDEDMEIDVYDSDTDDEASHDGSTSDPSVHEVSHLLSDMDLDNNTSAPSPTRDRSPFSIDFNLTLSDSDSDNSVSTYDDPRQILRPWTPSYFTYGYNHHGSLRTALTVPQAREFLDHPSRLSSNRPLALSLLQLPPASAFPSSVRPSCLLSTCPCPGPIQESEWVLSLDELSDFRSYRNFHPLSRSGWVHLYCAERWLNFVELCCVADYWPLAGRDDEFPSTLSKPVKEVLAEWFGTVRVMLAKPEWYPMEMDFAAGRVGYNHQTLGWWLVTAEFWGMEEREFSALKEREGRGAEKRHVHLGDLGVVVLGRRKEAGEVLTKEEEQRLRNSTHWMINVFHRNRWSGLTIDWMSLKWV